MCGGGQEQACAPLTPLALQAIAEAPKLAVHQSSDFHPSCRLGNEVGPAAGLLAGADDQSGNDITGVSIEIALITSAYGMGSY